MLLWLCVQRSAAEKLAQKGALHKSKLPVHDATAWREAHRVVWMPGCKAASLEACVVWQCITCEICSFAWGLTGWHGLRCLYQASARRQAG